MDYVSIIEIIPQLFMYLIPGYIALQIRGKYRQESSHKDKKVLILSIVYSFIIGRLTFIASLIIRAITKFELSIPSIFEIHTINEWHIIINLMLSVIVGYIITIYPDTKIAAFFRKISKSNTEPYSNVWNYAMKNPEGAWARIYLKDENTGYIGLLIKYTCDPDEKIRQVYLSKFTSFKIDQSEIIDDYSENENACVLINATDVKRIEIFKDIESR